MNSSLDDRLGHTLFLSISQGRLGYDESSVVNKNTERYVALWTH